MSQEFTGKDKELYIRGADWVIHDIVESIRDKIGTTIKEIEISEEGEHTK